MPLLGTVAAYLPTPRRRDGTVDTSALAALAARAVQEGVDALAVLGTNGGGVYLDRPARRLVVEAAVAATAGRVPVVAGVGALTTTEVLALAQDAFTAGADAVLLAPTSYLPLTREEVRGLFRDLAGAVPAPVWIYHNPVTTRFAFDVDLVAELARTLPAVRGVKDRGADEADVTAKVAALHAAVPAGFEVGFSGEVLGPCALRAGAATWHTALAAALPRDAVAVARHARGSAPEHSAVSRRWDAVARVVVDGGGPRALHAVGEILGLPVGHLPAPLRPASATVRDALEAALGGS